MNISIFLFIFIILLLLSLIKSQITYETLTKNMILYISCNWNVKDDGIFSIPVYSSNIDYENDFKNIELNSCFFTSAYKSFISANVTFFKNISDFYISFYIKPSEINTIEEFPLLTLISLTLNVDYDVVTLFNKSILYYYNLDEYSILPIDDFSLDNWYYISIKVVENNVNFYINGELKINVTLDNNINFDTISFNYLFIGGNPLKDLYYNGNIDEIRIVNLSDFKISDEQIYIYYHKNFCDEGYYYNVSLNSCQPCYDRHCINCFDSLYCYVCHDNFYLNDNMTTCICQKENCNQCDDEGVCIECIPGFSLNEKLNCILNNCDEFSFCSTCSLDKCITCMNNYKLNKNGDCKLPSKTITSLIICYIIVVIIVWIGVFVFAKPKFFKTINK